MGNKSYSANKSSLFAQSGSTELGGGKDTHLCVGPGYSGYDFRSALAFPAIDWSDVATVTKATLRLYVSSSSSGTHGPKSSSADVLVRRVSSSWTANSASSSGDSPSGSGWSTSPTTWPGPGTSTPEVTKTNVPTGSGAYIDIDVLAIVMKWAPVSIGGEGLPAYGFALHDAGGGYSEFHSAYGTDPRLYIDYTSAPPTTPVVSKPTGKSADTTPAYEWSAVHPDGAPITAWDLEDRVAGGAVTYSKVDQTSGIVTGKVTHTAATALSTGPREARARVFGGGLWSAWSAWKSYAIDRPPATPTMTAPAATVSGTRRPVHTFTWSDPDADAGEVFDVEVYQDAGGGVPAGSKVGGVTGAVVTGGTSPTSWTPTADLPGGPLLARSRVRTAGVWSSWSAYRAYTVVLTVPTILWTRPPADGAYAYPRASEWGVASRSLTSMAMEMFATTTTPPAGQTIATARYKVEVVDPGVGGPIVGTVLTDANQNVAGYAFAFRPEGYGAGAPTSSWVAGTLKVTATITASGGGVTTEVRHVRFALGECTPALALGDAVTDLAASWVGLVDDTMLAVRAQTSATAAVAGQVWQHPDNIAVVQAALPATNAYLGLRFRVARRADDAEGLTNGDFETGDLTGWSVDAGTTSVGTDTNAPAGSRMLIVTGIGEASNPGVQQRMDVLPGATYRVSAWARSSDGVAPARLQVGTRNPAGGLVNSAAISVQTLATAWTYLEGYVTIPTDGSVATISTYLRIPTVTAGHSVRFDGASVRGPVLGDGGLDVAQVSWKSLG